MINTYTPFISAVRKPHLPGLGPRRSGAVANRPYTSGISTLGLHEKGQSGLKNARNGAVLRAFRGDKNFDFERMGGTGLEPVTSCMSSKRSSHLS